MLAPRLDTQGKVAAEPLTSATFFHPRACAIEITWNIRSRGTKNVGTRLSGSTVIGSMERAAIATGSPKRTSKRFIRTRKPHILMYFHDD